jgi:hypothetical protein
LRKNVYIIRLNKTSVYIIYRYNRKEFRLSSALIAMFEQLGGFFKKGSQDTLVLGYTDVPAWLDSSEEQISSDLAESAKNPVEEISRIIGRLRQNLKILQEAETAGGDANYDLTVLDSLNSFIRQLSGPVTGDLPENTCRFFSAAENIFGTCNEAVIEHGQVLREVFPSEIAAVKEDTHALGRALMGARAPVIEKCRARTKLVTGVREVLSRIAEAEQDSTSSEEKIASIKELVPEISENISRLRTELAGLESDPEPFLKNQQQIFERLAAARDELRQSYTGLADVASALMAWARTIANEKNDSYANEVLLDLIRILMSNEVPDADNLMSALVCAFEIVLDMMESGDLVPGDEEAALVLKKPADFNNEMCRICREYAAVDARIRTIGPELLAERKQQLNDEADRLEARLIELETEEQDFHTRRTLAALRRQNLKKPLENALSQLTGSPVQVRLNGQVMPEPGAGGSADNAG